LGGVAVAIAGVAVCCYAGSLKEKELNAADKAKAILEFAFTKGVFVAIFAGIMSACMAFALTAGKPIADEAVKAGANPIFQTNATLVVVLLGGFVTNCLWCVFLNIRNKSGRDYLSGGPNYGLAALGGVLWYLQFFFYGMGTTRLGPYNFASWTIHMSFIIVFSTLWGLKFGEWAQVSRKTFATVVIGILVLVLSTVVIGYGNYQAAG
jgi:L-rhamnose-H+ transport protein